MRNVDWQTLIIALIVCAGVLFGPWELWLTYNRYWKRRQQQRAARGEAMTPRRVPDEEWDEED